MADLEQRITMTLGLHFARLFDGVGAGRGGAGFQAFFLLCRMSFTASKVCQGHDEPKWHMKQGRLTASRLR